MTKRITQLPIDSLKFDFLNENLLREGLLADHKEKLGPLEREIAETVTIPIAALLERAGEDPQMRADMSLLLLEAMALAFAQYLERKVNPSKLLWMTDHTIERFSQMMAKSLANCLLARAQMDSEAGNVNDRMY